MRALCVPRPLSEFVAACCTYALSIEQRAFVTELIELAAVRLLHCATAALPADVSVVLLASSRFVECSLCALEQACADCGGTAAAREAVLPTARRALAALLALCTDAAPEPAACSRAASGWA